MRYIIILSFLVLGFMHPNDLKAQKTKMDKFTVQVDGLGCPFCAYGLEKKFKQLKGIKKMSIDMESGILNFIYPAEAKLSTELVEKQVDLAGYTTVSMKVERASGKMEEIAAIQSRDLEGNLIRKTTFKVAGNCAMCKARIEKAAMSEEGVASAVWNKESKMIQLTFDGTKTDKGKVSRKISKSGHDTYAFKASKTDYKNLPVCCHYDRIP